MNQKEKKIEFYFLSFYLNAGIGEPCAGQVILRLFNVCRDTCVVVRSSDGSLGGALPIGSTYQNKYYFAVVDEATKTNLKTGTGEACAGHKSATVSFSLLLIV